MAVTKKRAGLPRLALAFRILGTRSGHGWLYEAGIRTVSTTWITPLD